MTVRLWHCVEDKILSGEHLTLLSPMWSQFIPQPRNHCLINWIKHHTPLDYMRANHSLGAFEICDRTNKCKCRRTFLIALKDQFKTYRTIFWIIIFTRIRNQWNDRNYFVNCLQQEEKVICFPQYPISDLPPHVKPGHALSWHPLA